MQLQFHLTAQTPTHTHIFSCWACFEAAGGTMTIGPCHIAQLELRLQEHTSLCIHMPASKKNMHTHKCNYKCEYIFWQQDIHRPVCPALCENFAKGCQLAAAAAAVAISQIYHVQRLQESLQASCTIYTQLKLLLSFSWNLQLQELLQASPCWLAKAKSAQRLSLCYTKLAISCHAMFSTEFPC